MLSIELSGDSASFILAAKFLFATIRSTSALLVMMLFSFFSFSVCSQYPTDSTISASLAFSILLKNFASPNQSEKASSPSRTI